MSQEINNPLLKKLLSVFEEARNKETKTTLPLSPETVMPKPEPDTTKIPLQSEVDTPPEPTTEASAQTEQGSIEQEETEMTMPEPENTKPITELAETILENVTQQTTPPEPTTEASAQTEQGSIEQEEMNTTEQSENNDNNDESDKTIA